MKRPAVLALVIPLILSTGFTGAAGAKTPTKVTPASVTSASAEARSTYIVQFAPGSDVAALASSARSAGIGVQRTIRNVFPGMVATMTPTQAQAMARNPRVVLVEADSVVDIKGTQTNPTWGLDRTDQRNRPLDASFSYPNSGAGVATYIVDTGVNASHSEFTGRMASGFTAVADGNGTSDCNGHGTHVAGTVAGTRYGVAKSATVIPVRVLDCAGSGYVSWIVSGLDWVKAHHADGVPAVANLSLGGGASTSLDNAVQAVIDDGVTVVVAAGNSNADACRYSPARVTAAITTGATDSADKRASFSNFGKCLDLFAPGVSITSAWHTSSTAISTISGTSMAAPHVAGVAAIVLAAYPRLTPAQVAQRIASDATGALVGSAGSGSPNLLLHLSQSVGNDPVVEEPVVEPPVVEPPVSDATVPEAATNVSASAGKRSATVNWTLGSDGGSAITGSTVRIYSGGKLVGTASVSGTASSVTISGLKAGTSYTFATITHNAVGSSPESSRSNSVVPLR
jgi:subtilisin family serine protease